MDVFGKSCCRASMGAEVDGSWCSGVWLVSGAANNICKDVNCGSGLVEVFAGVICGARVGTCFVLTSGSARLAGILGIRTRFA